MGTASSAFQMNGLETYKKISSNIKGSFSDINSVSTTPSGQSSNNSIDIQKFNQITPIDAQKFSEYFSTKKIIGRGASGKVFLVEERKSGKMFACKVIYKNRRINDSKTMGLEVDIFLKTHHKNIVSLYKIFENDHSLSLVLEYASEGTLQEMLVRSPELYNEVLVSKYFKQVLEGVQYLHSLGIVHRDLKIDNILCTNINKENSSISEPEYLVKITDYGLSARIKIKEDCGCDSNLKKAKKFKGLKEMWGTTENFAPEIYKEAYGPQVDVWALGCVLFELLTGEQPFPTREVDMSLIDRILLNGGKKPKREFQLRPSWQTLSPEVQDLLLGMLKKKPTKRLTLCECLNHPWIKNMGFDHLSELSGALKLGEQKLDRNAKILKKMELELKGEIVN